jgi:hypothetical protein
MNSFYVVLWIVQQFTNGCDITEISLVGFASYFLVLRELGE